MLWRILSEGDEDLGTWEGESPAEAHDAFARSTGETSGAAQAKAIGLEYGTLLACLTIGPIDALGDLGDIEAPRYRTDEMAQGDTCSLREMIEANSDTPEVIERLHALRVGQESRDIVTMTRVA